MELLKSYILPRVLQWLVVIVVGVTITFTIPRLLPGDPVEQTLRRVLSNTAMDPRAIQNFENALRDMYGLQGSPVEQYFRFWGRLLQGDLGPSLGSFPTPVTTIIATAPRSAAAVCLSAKGQEPRSTSTTAPATGRPS